MKPYLRALSLNLMIAAFASPVFISSAHAANLPQSVSLQYAGHYNGLTLPATMTFTRNGKGYKVVSTIKVPALPHPFRIRRQHQRQHHPPELL